MRNQDQFDTTMEEQDLADNPLVAQNSFEPVEESDAGKGILRTAPTIVVKKDDSVVFEHTLEDFPVHIGRKSTNHIVLDEKNVSRVHAQILMKGDNYFIQDSGSTGGTKVNGEPVKEKEIHTGDSIEIGHFLLQFSSGNPEDERTIFDADDSTVLEDGTEVDDDRTLFYEESVAKLVVMHANSLEGEIFLDENETTLGRDEDADININDKRISRQHCKIWLDGHHYKLTDLGSANGSFVNGQRVSEKSLENGDRIQIGSSQFKFLIESTGVVKKSRMFPIVMGTFAVLGIAAVIFLLSRLLPQFLTQTPHKVILEKLWEQPTTASVSFSPSPGDVNGDGHMDLVIADAGGYVHAVDARQGGSIWNSSLNLEGGPFQCSPLLADINKVDGEFDVVIATSTLGLWAVDGSTRKEIWRGALDSGVPGTPAAADVNYDGTSDIFVGTKRGTVTCFDGRQGNTLWTVSLDAALQTAPRLADMNRDGCADVVIGGNDYRVHVLDGRNGQTIWTFVGTDVPSTAAIADMNSDKIPDVSVITPVEAIVLDGRAGSVLWRWTLPQTARPRSTDPFVPAPPAISDLNSDKTPDVILSTAGGHIYAIDGASDGEACLWDYDVTSSRKTAPALCDLNDDGIDDVIFGDRNGNLTVIDGKDSHLLKQITVSGSIVEMPVIADMNGNGNADIVVISRNKKIVAVETQSPVNTNQIVWNSY
ncbi:FHA domain-containing protein [candidate division KSB1 bacterium]|nr:FHA domain-containing protein [candidate division KSB1 bacterium]